MEQIKIEKIAETFKDEEFSKRIIEIKEKEELIKAFAEKGLELSLEEVDEFIQKGQAIIKQVKLEKIAETFKDEEFAKRIIEIKEKEELIKAFAEKGLELSVEEVDGLIQKGKEAISNGEFDQIKKALSEDELENVSGGSASDFVEGLTAFPRAITYAIQNSPEDPAFAAGILISAAALTALAAPTVYKGLKAAGKGIYKAGSKVYNKITDSSKSNEN